MKRCPKCGSSYTDDTLIFCLTDGSALEEIDSAATVSFEGSNVSEPSDPRTTDEGRVRIDIPGTEEKITVENARTKNSREPERRGFGYGALAALVVVLLLIVTGLSAFVVYMLMQPDTQNSNASFANSSNRDAEVEALKQRIDELGNKLENSNSDAPEEKQTPERREPEFDEEVIQRVNSPSDGFLALRDRPSAREGKRIAKIPHGDIVILGRCQDREETIQERTGRWCRVRWEGKTGWVFDVWLTD